MKNVIFTKMHGLGNDFVILDGRVQPIENKAELAKKMADRHFGVGCDQLIIMEPSDKADLFMRILNPDGSEAGACGNATRCVADILMRETGKTSCTIETLRGVLSCERAGTDQVQVDMGEPLLEWNQIPLAREMDTLSLLLGKNGVSNPTAVNMGNPHCVFFVENMDAVDVAAIGPQFERDPLFPQRTNVEFVEVINKGHVRMRVWERGAGITLACGSGACATAVAAIRRGLTTRKMTVTMDGGDLTLEWREADNRVYMTGPVAYVFSGTFLLT